MRGRSGHTDTSSMITAETECPVCGSDALIEHAVHDGMGGLINSNASVAGTSWSRSPT